MWVFADILYTHTLIRGIPAHGPIGDEVSLNPGAIPEVQNPAAKHGFNPGARHGARPIPIGYPHAKNFVGREILVNQDGEGREVLGRDCIVGMIPPYRRLAGREILLDS